MSITPTRRALLAAGAALPALSLLQPASAQSRRILVLAGTRPSAAGSVAQLSPRTGGVDVRAVLRDRHQ